MANFSFLVHPANKKDFNKVPFLRFIPPPFKSMIARLVSPYHFTTITHPSGVFGNIYTTSILPAEFSRKTITREIKAFEKKSKNIKTKGMGGWFSAINHKSIINGRELTVFSIVKKINQIQPMSLAIIGCGRVGTEVAKFTMNIPKLLIIDIVLEKAELVRNEIKHPHCIIGDSSLIDYALQEYQVCVLTTSSLDFISEKQPKAITINDSYPSAIPTRFISIKAGLINTPGIKGWFDWIDVKSDIVLPSCLAQTIFQAIAEKCNYEIDWSSHDSIQNLLDKLGATVL